MNEFKKVLFIVNRFAGTGYSSALERKIHEVCSKHAIKPAIEFTSSRGHATELARHGIQHADAIVAVGGDGTVNEVAQGLLSTKIPLGIIPTGSGNGLARHLMIPLKPTEALASLLSGKIIDMDSFKINNRLSVNVSGIGFDGHIASLFSTAQKRGLFGYVQLVLKEYFSSEEFNWQLQSENKITQHRSFIIAIANSSQYGNNAFIAPHASVTDGELSISSVKKIPLNGGPSFTYQLFTKNLQPGKRINFIPVKNCTVTTDKPLAFHCDGESCGHTDLFSIEILPASLKIIVPATSQP